MPEITLESLATRLADLESKVAGLQASVVTPPSRDWQSVFGLFSGSEFSREMDAEIAIAREAERAAAREGVICDHICS